MSITVFFKHIFYSCVLQVKTPRILNETIPAIHGSGTASKNLQYNLFESFLHRNYISLYNYPFYTSLTIKA